MFQIQYNIDEKICKYGFSILTIWEPREKNSERSRIKIKSRFERKRVIMAK